MLHNKELRGVYRSPSVSGVKYRRSKYDHPDVNILVTRFQLMFYVIILLPIVFVCLCSTLLYSCNLTLTVCCVFPLCGYLYLHCAVSVIGPVVVDSYITITIITIMIVQTRGII
jgi:hypothetical protein